MKYQVKSVQVVRQNNFLAGNDLQITVNEMLLLQPQDYESVETLSSIIYSRIKEMFNKHYATGAILQRPIILNQTEERLWQETQRDSQCQDKTVTKRLLSGTSIQWNLVKQWTANQEYLKKTNLSSLANLPCLHGSDSAMNH